jgi:2-polyprenyl-3-methyl-5-hydroxy-6-metoxy-1,4-benzoquinol methylase
MAKNEENLCQIRPSQTLAEGLEHYHAGNFAQTMRVCQEVLRDYPQNAEALHRLGMTFIAAGQYSSAVETIKQAIAIDPNRPAYYSSVGVALQKLNRWEEAAANYQVALAMKPDFADALDNLSRLARERDCRDSDTIDRADCFYQNSRERIDNSLCSTAFAIRQYYSEERMRFFQMCLQLLKDSGIAIEDKHIVDVACGMGYQLRLVSEYKPASITGLDFSRVAIEIAKLLCPGGRFCEFDIYQKYNETFDVIICTEALEHFLYPSISLKNILSMIRANGCAFLTVPNGRIDTFDGHINFWSPESWRMFIEEHCEGFDIRCGALRKENLYALIRSRR